MFSEYVISTNVQKVLRFLSLHQEKPCYEREVAKGAKISYGSANSVLRELHKSGLLQRTTQGKMCYYSIDMNNPHVREFKILVNILTLEPIVERLKAYSSKVVLYGSWAEGTDTEQSDIDLFVISSEERHVKKIVNKFSETERVASRKIQVIVYEPADLINIEKREKVFLGQVEKGKVLWERSIGEDNI